MKVYKVLDLDLVGDLAHKLDMAPIMTQHVVERQIRVKVYQNYNLLSTDFIDGFLVDKNHVHGLEYHLINTSGLIYVLNKNTLRLVTILCARPQQIKRYYEQTKTPIGSLVRDVIQQARDNVKEGLNEI